MKFRFMELAKSLSKFSSHVQHHHGCIITRKNKILGQGFNQDKTHPKSPHPHFSIHAELAAILNARYTNIEGATVYIYRQRKDGNTAMSKPCPYCLELLRQYKIKDCYFTTETGIEYLEIA